MMKHYTLYIYRTLLLFALLSVGGTGEAWGQWGQNNISETVTPDNEIEEIVYVFPDQPKDIILQRQGGNNGNDGTPGETNNNIDNLDGYIRWYSKIGTGSNGITGLTRKSNNNNHQLKQYSNGFAWTRESSDGASPSAACWIECEFSQTQLDLGVVVYCDASSTQATIDGSGNLTPKRISIRHKYIIRNASERVQLIREKKTALDGLGLTLTGNGASVRDLIDSPDRSAYVLNTYEIHTPNPYGTNYRLPEKLSNYFVPSGRSSSQATNVRWIFYDENGNYIVHEDNNTNIVTKRFDYQNDDIQHKRYILTLVRAGNQGEWYPVSFLDITLEPFSEHLTEDELQNTQYKDNPNYRNRYVDDLVKQGKYELLGEAINFDTDIMNNPYNTLSQSNSKYRNISSEPFSGSESFYAFAAPLEFSQKKNNRVSIGRGEYALYRTLNYDGISGYNETFTYQGDEGRYTDYFAMSSLLYDKRAVDRLWEKTDGEQSGYFMYLDATDEPGVITKIEIDELCPNTSLIVTAWVCDLTHSSDASHADVGFTFKSRDNAGNETILTKYYTGALDNKPGFTAPEQSQARWQQVAFKFSFSRDMITAGNTYILEISNNCSSSNGADYGIDDIQVYRSLPDIDVQRADECDASTLVVRSEYETILNNMCWTKGEDITVDDDLYQNDLQYRKYRYGLMGNVSGTDEPDLDKNNTEGNVYFAFLDDQDNNNWITVNKEAKNQDLGPAASSVRVIVSTDIEAQDFPKTEEEAILAEHTLNIRAIRDYNRDIDRWKTDDEAEYRDRHSDGVIELDFVDENENITDMKKYQEALVELYYRLRIPRIHMPWKETRQDGTVVLCLDKINVNNTDLKYQGEPIYADTNDDGILELTGNEDGKYRVIMFTGEQVLAGVPANPTDPCALISPFTVHPATTIKVEAVANSDVALCAGGLRKITALLNAYDKDMNPVSLDVNSYVFDWYLGTRDEYDGLTSNGTSVKNILSDIRTNYMDDKLAPITVEIIQGWKSSNQSKTQQGDLLIDLLQKDLLKTGTKPSQPFNLFINSNEIVALPYVSGDNTNGYIYCTSETNVNIPLSGKDTPELHTGFTGITYPFDGEVPLRLGQRHLTSLTIPIQTGEGKILMAPEAEYLGMLPEGTGRDVSLLNDELPTIGTVTALEIKKDATEASVSVTFNEEAKGLLQEGESYELLIPFAQYGANNTLMSSECDGLISLPVKIVPEYLTWQGDADAVWYKDANWKQSTKGELYKDDPNGTNTTDANGSDDVSKAFAPLYFTKITIPAGKTLPLEDEQGKLAIAEQEGRLNLDSKDATDNIEYDMAVNNTDANGAIKVVPYYGNEVSEIYFKPDARLQRQQYLEYDTARVEFEMTEGQKYWMASPLQDVFAGDMYAPKGTARQNTYAFDPIFYSKGDNDRQNPSFYQKAWDKGVNIYTDAGGTTSTPYSVVKSNWSVEYNDVNVPYALGKGFYASVEDIEGDNVSALVRLPKADKSYTYEELKTKAASTIANRPNAGKLAGNEDVTVVLTDNDAVGNWGDGNNQADGDSEHFLLGNPYMYPLDMAKFLDANKEVLAQKYWTLSAEGSASVGTPDLKWDGEKATGEIAPMQAFFVELVTNATAGENTIVKFIPDMMVGEDSNPPSTRSVIAASAPVLRLTAEKDGKRSIAYLTQHDDATNDYDADKDAITLLDSELAEIPQVYTVAGDRAAGVNAVKEITNIPLGVYTDSAQDEVTLTIEGISQLIGTLYLYDAQTRKSQALTGDSHTLHLTGSSHGRYFLRSSENPTGNEAISADAISIYSAVAGRVIVCATAPLARVRVVTMGGQVIRSLVPNQPVSTIRLPKGIYIVHAESNGVVKTEKVMVR